MSSTILKQSVETLKEQFENVVFEKAEFEDHVTAYW